MPLSKYIIQSAELTTVQSSTIHTLSIHEEAKSQNDVQGRQVHNCRISFSTFYFEAYNGLLPNPRLPSLVYTQSPARI